MDLDKTYVCPDCGGVSMGYDLVYPTDSETLYVCTHCGCVQDVDEVERQCGYLVEEIRKEEAAAKEAEVQDNE